jgi:hypothetical protein
MNETKFDQELAVNRQAYEKLRDQIRRDYDHQYVAIAFGKLVGSAATFDEASAVIDRLDPKPQHFLVFQADDEPMFDEYFDPYTEFQ